jgi:hypothetical protein
MIKKIVFITMFVSLQNALSVELDTGACESALWDGDTSKNPYSNIMNDRRQPNRRSGILGLVNGRIDLQTTNYNAKQFSISQNNNVFNVSYHFDGAHDTIHAEKFRVVNSTNGFPQQTTFSSSSATGNNDESGNPIYSTSEVENNFDFYTHNNTKYCFLKDRSIQIDGNQKKTYDYRLCRDIYNEMRKYDFNALINKCTNEFNTINQNIDNLFKNRGVEVKEEREFAEGVEMKRMLNVFGGPIANVYPYWEECSRLGAFKSSAEWFPTSASSNGSENSAGPSSSSPQ